MRLGSVLIVAVSTALLGCAGASSSPTSTPRVVALPTVPRVPTVCRGIGGPPGPMLKGDPKDPHVTWTEGFGNRGEIVWPPGYRARFAPTLEVLDAVGNVVYRAGDRIPGGCAVGPDDDPSSVLLILPPRPN